MVYWDLKLSKQFTNHLIDKTQSQFQPHIWKKEMRDFILGDMLIHNLQSLLQQAF